eukprot:4807047-Alexandrium_andersonii.AAC.1
MAHWPDGCAWAVPELSVKAFDKDLSEPPPKKKTGQNTKKEPYWETKHPQTKTTLSIVPKKDRHDLL